MRHVVVGGHISRGYIPGSVVSMLTQLHMVYKRMNVEEYLCRKCVMRVTISLQCFGDAGPDLTVAIHARPRSQQRMINSIFYCLKSHWILKKKLVCVDSPIGTSAIHRNSSDGEWRFFFKNIDYCRQTKSTSHRRLWRVLL